MYKKLHLNVVFKLKPVFVVYWYCKYFSKIISNYYWKKTHTFKKQIKFSQHLKIIIWAELQKVFFNLNFLIPSLPNVVLVVVYWNPPRLSTELYWEDGEHIWMYSLTFADRWQPTPLWRVSRDTVKNWLPQQLVARQAGVVQSVSGLEVGLVGAGDGVGGGPWVTAGLEGLSWGAEVRTQNVRTCYFQSLQRWLLASRKPIAPSAGGYGAASP